MSHAHSPRGEQGACVYPQSAVFMTKHAHLISSPFFPRWDAADSPFPFSVHSQCPGHPHAYFSRPREGRRQKARKTGSSPRWRPERLRLRGDPPQGRRVRRARISKDRTPQSRARGGPPARPPAAKLPKLPGLQAQAAPARARTHACRARAPESAPVVRGFYTLGRNNEPGECVRISRTAPRATRRSSSPRTKEARGAPPPPPAPRTAQAAGDAEGHATGTLTRASACCTRR